MNALNGAECLAHSRANNGFTEHTHNTHYIHIFFFFINKSFRLSTELKKQYAELFKEG